MKPTSWPLLCCSVLDVGCSMFLRPRSRITFHVSRLRRCTLLHFVVPLLYLKTRRKPAQTLPCCTLYLHSPLAGGRNIWPPDRLEFRICRPDSGLGGGGWRSTVF